MSREPKPVTELKLPPMGAAGVFGARVVDNAMTIILLIIGGMIVAGLIAGSVVTIPVTVGASGILEPSVPSIVRSTREGVTLSTWHAVLLVDASNFDGVRVGNAASVEVPALRGTPAQRLPGVVDAIDTLPGSALGATSATGTQSPSAALSYRVRVSLDERELRAAGADRLRRGYAATAQIVITRSTILDLLSAKLTKLVQQLRTLL